MLRSLSDPVLIKTSTSNFLKNWNSDAATPCQLSPIANSSETLFSSFYSLAETESMRNTKITKFEKDRRLKKLEIQMKRKNSVLIANIKQINDLFGLRKSWSCMDLSQICCQEANPTKRVSFSVNTPPTSENDVKVQLGSKSNTKPILVKKANQTTNKESLTHMDFDSFIAWRRGSRMSGDVERSRSVSTSRKELKTKRKTAALQNEQNYEDWWIVRVLRLGFDSCFHRQRVTPSPASSSAEKIVISIIDSDTK